MRVEPTSRRHLGEQRRYFPDWTDRPLESRPELEADRNSYLAGGYAEEFGYRATLACSRGVPVLEQEAPELCSEWHSQARAMHPGYPLRPHPFAEDLDAVGPEHPAGDVSHHAREYDNRLTWERADVEHHGAYVVVSHRRYERERHGAVRRAASVSTRLVAALASLRWALRRR